MAFVYGFLILLFCRISAGMQEDVASDDDDYLDPNVTE